MWITQKTWFIEIAFNAADSCDYRHYIANNTCLTPKLEPVGHSMNGKGTDLYPTRWSLWWCITAAIFALLGPLYNYLFVLKIILGYITMIKAIVYVLCVRVLVLVLSSVCVCVCVVGGAGGGLCTKMFIRKWIYSKWCHVCSGSAGASVVAHSVALPLIEIAFWTLDCSIVPTCGAWGSATAAKRGPLKQSWAGIQHSRDDEPLGVLMQMRNVRVNDFFFFSSLGVLPGVLVDTRLLCSGKLLRRMCAYCVT